MDKQTSSKGKISKARLVLESDSGEITSIPLEVLYGTQGPPAFDIQNFLKQHQCMFFDPGFTSTAACTSSITYIEGQNGILTYRGYPVQQLAAHQKFLEVAYLLLEGDLPSEHVFEDFKKRITHHAMVHEQLPDFFRGFRRDAHPMAIMVGVVGALSSFYHERFETEGVGDHEFVCTRLLAKMPTLAAMTYKYVNGQPFVYPQNHLDYVTNFLHMLFSTPFEPYIPEPLFTKALEKILILHADHEQNASTSTVRMAGSSGANPFACIASWISSLWGPSHGGANEAVLRMLSEIGTLDRIPHFIQRAKDRQDPFRLMGFGHRIYKTYDPRATCMQEICHEIFDHMGTQPPAIFQIAQALEKIAQEDDYFVSRHLYPNVDFYSGIVLKALGIPENMFTVIFAVGRTTGWLDHWKEMVSEDYKIARPRQIYKGNLPIKIL